MGRGGEEHCDGTVQTCCTLAGSSWSRCLVFRSSHVSMSNSDLLAGVLSARLGPPLSAGPSLKRLPPGGNLRVSGRLETGHRISNQTGTIALKYLRPN